ncbi:hypothetical protein H105_04164 [Trichophyton soudanense CBS 452.61]|nr:hypothetical protein H105_04164 [Trichophyton soudanense CBS 452.61]EZG06572.1 hypothetical protein H106_03960 [Trichophyton rubrum CBS 735.88]
MVSQNPISHGGSSNALVREGLCLLLLDGGGVPGLLSVYILKAIMDRLNTGRRDSHKVKPLTVIMLGQLEMGEGGCIDIYCRVFNKVFNEKKHFTLMNISGKIQARFDSDKLEKIIKEIISRKGIPEN